MKKQLCALLCGLGSMAAAQAAVYDDATASNTMAGAANLDPFFSLEFNPDVGNITGANTSTTNPWVTVSGLGDGAYDYFSFSSAGGTIVADIDYTFANPANRQGFDAEIAIWKANGNGTFTKLAENDDFSIVAGAGGSVHEFDSFIQLDNVAAGRYVVGVARFSANATDTGWSGNVIDQGKQYALSISVSPVPEPETYAMLLAGLGLVGMVARRRMAH